MSFPGPIGEWDARTAAKDARPGVSSGFVLGRSRGWNLPTGVLPCAPSLWTQLTPAGHETGVFSGVLPRLKVALVFPTRSLACEGLALRCNSNKSPNHLDSQMTGTKDAIHLVLPEMSTRNVPPAQGGGHPTTAHPTAAILSWPPHPGETRTAAVSIRERWAQGSRRKPDLACRLPRAVECK